MAKTVKDNLLQSLFDSSASLHSAALKISSSLEEADSSFPIEVQGSRGSLNSFFLNQVYKCLKTSQLHDRQYGKANSPAKDLYIVVPTSKDADEVESDLNAAFSSQVDVFKFPWWGMIPYKSAALNSLVFGQRASILSHLTVKNYDYDRPRVFIFNQRSLLTAVPPPKYVRSLIKELKKGQTQDIKELEETLANMGYLRVPRVTVHGEFAVRGEVIDFFMPGDSLATRIVFDFDTIEQIKTFEADTQVSHENIQSVLVYPMKEVIWNDELTGKLEEAFAKENELGIRNNFAEYDAKRKAGLLTDSEQNDEDETVLDKNLIPAGAHLAFTEKALERKEQLLCELGVNRQSEGEELFYGFIFDRQYTLFDYLPKDALVFFYDYERLLNGPKMLLNEYSFSYRTARQEMPVFPPSQMLFDFEKVMEGVNNKVFFHSVDTLLKSRELEASAQDESAEQESAEQEAVEEQKDSLENSFSNIISLDAQMSQSYFGNINYLKEQLAQLQGEKWHIYIFADNANQSVRLREVFKDFIETEDKKIYPLELFPFPITQGFSLPQEKILVIQENEIFGRKKAQAKISKNAKSKPIDTFIELKPGDYVVHVNFGIGLFKGIERMKTMGLERDYIKLIYAGDEIAFVPVEQVNMVQRYIADGNRTPALDKIGSKSWASRKAKVREKVEEMAEKLIDLYSKRQASRGYAFPKDGEWQAAFEAAFPYEDTPDQFTTTQDIKNDMESSVPMDRLVCGDVGYGKTEIAMRAAFKAVMGGKQVAFLAPTTILAEQHYENAVERFKNFPVKIAQLSRFVSPADQKKTLKDLEEGKIDLLIGTHRIIQKDVKYRDLGLFIVDEEQRFGVKDKERLKELKHNIDCLAMSATPIPRTLHMSLLNIRDMSVLATAPQSRIPVETVIEGYSDEKVALAIRQEVKRGGQVFYLHNRVESLDEVMIKLRKIVPEMLVDVAHGQMSSDQLDDIFRRFKMGGFHILVSTTIIENGIDIPNVNTIIIDRADMYGVSQLYQLRGRVGRSDKKAYAYLFYPENKELNEVAMKRLQVISDFTELGSGFKIAMKDMEIRGAGNLLGKDQSGEVYAVGFDMYLSLLNAAIEKLTRNGWEQSEEVLLELEYSGFIPETYIQEPEIKMEIYKKIAAIREEYDYELAQMELEDRFGPIPEEVNSLLSIAKIRIICKKLKVDSLKEKKGLVSILFNKKSQPNIDKLMKLISTSGNKIKMNPQNTYELIMSVEKIDINTKSEFIREKLEMLL